MFEFSGDNYRAVPFAHARSGAHDQVMIGYMRERVGRDCRHFELRPLRTFVEGLNVLQKVFDRDAFEFYLPARESVKHECIVGVRTMPDTNCSLCHIPLEKSLKIAIRGVN